MFKHLEKITLRRKKYLNKTIKKELPESQNRNKNNFKLDITMDFYKMKDQIGWEFYVKMIIIIITNL